MFYGIPSLGLNYVTDAQRYTSDDTTTPLVAPGSISTVRLADQYTSFVYVKYGAAVAINQIACLYLNKDNADVDAAAAITDKTLTGTADFTADEFGGQAAWAVIDLNGGLKQGGHYIQRNTANILYTDRVWDEALTTASDYLVHELNSVVLADADAVATAHTAGVAISAGTLGRYGWLQISGVHWRVRSVGTTDAAVIGEGVMASSTAGVCKGWTNAATTAEDVHFTFGMALCSDAEADAAAEGIPVKLTDCVKFWG